MGKPFPPDVYAARMERVARAAAGKGLTGLLVTPGPDLAYLTGYEPPINERLTVLVLPTDREPVMVVPRLERGSAEKCPGGSQLRLLDWADGTDPYGLTGGMLAELGTYGITDSAWALHVLALQEANPEVAYTSMTRTLPMLRAVKDEAEITRLGAAGAGADRAYEEILKRPFAGRTELEVSADLADLLRHFGHETADFALVCSGPNGADPHHRPGSRIIEHGDMVVMDFGGKFEGYGSDTTRTVHVGPPSELESSVYDIVKTAQQAAFEAVKPGVTCEEIDRVARDVIAEAGYAEQFVHRTGHGIGLSGHEPPYIVRGERQQLVPGMCFSIEPGIYLNGRFGVRIEDIVTVTDTGCRRFNESSRELVIVS